jgi:hypothetical protein
MRHVLHLMQPARPGVRGGDEGRPTGPCAFPATDGSAESATSTVAIRNHRSTSIPVFGRNAQIADNSSLPGERAKSTRGVNLSKAETRHKAQTGSEYTAVCGGKKVPSKTPCISPSTRIVTSIPRWIKV